MRCWWWWVGGEEFQTFCNSGQHLKQDPLWWVKAIVMVCVMDVFSKCYDGLPSVSGNKDEERVCKSMQKYV